MASIKLKQTLEVKASLILIENTPTLFISQLPTLKSPSKPKLTYSHAQEIFPTVYQLGGICFVTVNSLTGQISHTMTNALGNWNFVTLQTNYNQTFLLITIYQPDEFKGHVPEPFTFYTQNSRLLDQAKISCYPCMVFMENLSALLITLPENIDLLIGENFYEDLIHPTSCFTPLLTMHHLADAFQVMHPETTYNLFICGKCYMDFLLVSACLVLAFSAQESFHLIFSSSWIIMACTWICNATYFLEQLQFL